MIFIVSCLFRHARTLSMGALMVADLGILSGTAQAQASAFDITRQPIADAIISYGQQAKVRIVLAGTIGTNAIGNAVRGVMTKEQALDRLLAGTGVAVTSRNGAVVILGARRPSQRDGSDREREHVTKRVPSVESILIRATRDALSTKRYAAQIMDTLTAAQLRTAPDLDVVDAARRIVGVSAMPSTDDNRSDNTLQSITIRGLNNSYNLITLDGGQIASANNTYRGARLDLIPASMLGELQILKTVDAYNDPQGVGGQVNMVTKSAFDYGNSLDTQLLGGWNSTSGQVNAPFHQNWRVDGMVTRVFGRNKEFGLVVSGSYQELHSATHAILPGDTNGDGWNYFSTSGSSATLGASSDAKAVKGSPVPLRVQDYAFDDAYRRYSVNGKLQYRPSQSFDASIFASYFSTLDQTVRNEGLSSTNGLWTPGTTSNTGRLSIGDYEIGLTKEPELQRTWFFNSHAHYDINEHMRIDLFASDSIAFDGQVRNMVKYNTGINQVTNKTTQSENYGYTYTIDDGAPIIQINNLASANNPDNYGPRYWRFYNYNVRNTVRFLRGDWRWEMGRGFWTDIGTTQTLTHVSNSEGYAQFLPNGVLAASEIGNMEDVLASRSLLLKSAPGLTYFLLDPSKAFSKLADQPGLFRQTDTSSTTKPAYYHLQESITAAYYQTGWHNNYLSLQGGFRWDHTNVGINNVNQQVVGAATSYVPQYRTSTYDYIVPSVLTALNLTRSMKLRADFTETLGRPNYGNYGAATATTFSGASVSISEGNPNLMPRHSWNYDLAYEWYPQKDTILSVGVFYKDIHDEIYTRSVQTTASIGGQIYPAVISQPLNSSGAGLRGIEMQLARQKFGFLPGKLKNFGISFNATFLGGFFEVAMADGTSRKVGGLVNQPSHIYNASLFYADDRFEGRVAYDRVGRSLYSTSGSAVWQDIWMQERGQIDLQLNYRFTKWLSGTGQVQNLTASGYQTRMGLYQDLIQDSHPSGRTVWLGLRFQPQL